MVKVAPEIYTKYVIFNSKGETVMYVRLLNALYGIMKAALLYYQRFVTDLKSVGFRINPYDPCVANKTVKGKQLTVIWHIDDLKVSHVLATVVTIMAAWLKRTYEQLFDDGSGEMKICQGKIYDYLGMRLDFTVPGQVRITMIPYVNEILNQFSEYDNSALSTAATPAAKHLFKVNDEAKPLTEDQKTVFHNFVVKCLFLTKHVWPDIATAVAFLTIHIKASDEDNWKKLTHMIRYLRGTIELPLILPYPNGGLTDLMPHILICMATLVAVCPLAKVCQSTPPPSKRSIPKVPLKLNLSVLTISCQSFSEPISFLKRRVTVTKILLKRRVTVTKILSFFFKDKQSVILLERNGRKSSSKQTKHLTVVSI
jgi:hypothetical protein